MRRTERLSDEERKRLLKVLDDIKSLFEWRRGPRTSEEVASQQALFQDSDSVIFGPAEAIFAADLYRKVKRSRGREIDIAITACAIVHSARLWTLNSADFKDIPGLTLLPFE